jgi:type II secretion system protein I
LRIWSPPPNEFVGVFIGNWISDLKKSFIPKSAIQNPKSEIRGFTLLEVLIAVAILGSAFAVILGTVNRNLILASDSKNLTIAEELIQTKITEIELEGFPESREEEGEFEEAPGFKWFLSIKPVTIPVLGEIRTVRLLITWDDGRKDLEVTLAMSELK